MPGECNESPQQDGTDHRSYRWRCPITTCAAPAQPGAVAVGQQFTVAGGCWSRRLPAGCCSQVSRLTLVSGQLRHLVAVVWIPWHAVCSSRRCHLEESHRHQTPKPKCSANLTRDSASADSKQSCSEPTEGTGGRPDRLGFPPARRSGFFLRRPSRCPSAAVPPRRQQVDYHESRRWRAARASMPHTTRPNRFLRPLPSNHAECAGRHDRAERDRSRPRNRPIKMLRRTTAVNHSTARSDRACESNCIHRGQILT